MNLLAGSNGKQAEPEPAASVYDKHKATMISTASLNARRTHVLEVVLIGVVALALLEFVYIMSRPAPKPEFIVVNGHQISEPLAAIAAAPDDKTWIAGEFVTLFRTDVFPDRTRSFLVDGSPVVGIVKRWNDIMSAEGFRVSGVSLQQVTKVSNNPETWEVDWLETRDNDLGNFEMMATVTLAFTPSDPVLPVNPWGAHVTNLFVVKEAKVR